MMISALVRRADRTGSKTNTMSRRIYFDGLNLSLERGTGIATYTRVLAQIARDLGHEIGVVYSLPQRPAKSPLMREISFFDSRDTAPVALPKLVWNTICDQLRSTLGVQPSEVKLTGTVITDQFQARLPLHDQMFVARNLFANARWYFSWSGRFIDLSFGRAPPDIFHCTYQLPLRVKRARNVYTIHDLVPLRLPYTTLDNKRQTYRLLRKIAAEADHIVTVSENSKRDIVQILGVEEERVTNTYEAVDIPRELVERPEDLVAEELRGSYRLELRGYLLFYGALEPKKNVGRLIDAYMRSAVDIPLVITGAVGWGNRAEAKMLERLLAEERARPQSSRRIYHLEYVNLPMLVTLIRGARAQARCPRSPVMPPCTPIPLRSRTSPWQSRQSPPMTGCAANCRGAAEPRRVCFRSHAIASVSRRSTSGSVSARSAYVINFVDASAEPVMPT